MGTERDDDEAITLIRSLQAGDQTAFHELMKILQKVVEYNVWRFTHGDVRYVDDFLQEAWIGVYKAAQHYDTITYPRLLKSYFANAVINQLVCVDAQTTGSLIPPRAVSRFLHDVAKERVDWSQPNDEIHHSYPAVRVSEIEHVRASGGYSVTYVSHFDEMCDSIDDTHSDAIVFEEWATTRVDVIQILAEVKAQVSPVQYRIFELRFLKDLNRPTVAKMLEMSVVRVYELERQLLATQFLVHYPSQNSGTPETLRTLLTQALSLTA
jgi:RNA polymerase sigma factor (sigma-70 family)